MGTDVLGVESFKPLLHVDDCWQVGLKSHDVVELDLIGSDDVDGHNHLVISD